MAKRRNVYVCQECGEQHPRWSGKCDACGAWNSVREELAPTAEILPGRSGKPVPITQVKNERPERMLTGIREFDRVLGGGLVAGSALLVGGEPGVGKSTLLLEIVAHRASAGGRPLYVTAEEAASQVAERARRLGIASDRLLLLGEDRLEPILDTLLDDPPEVLVVDSIQTIRKASLGSAAGTVAQVRECASDLVAAARSVGCALILVGHVTKDGMIAGPRVLEHLVDAVAYFEGERETEFRILRALKNRFGPAGEIAVFAMSERGLVDPEQPAAAFLGAARGLPGAVVGAVVEGSRVFLVEVQALTATATYGPPRVRSNGVDPARASMLAAVLARRCGLHLLDQDIHLNVAGGFKVSDPGCDLAICLAIASSFLDRPLAAGTIAFGEVGLGGEVRAARQAVARVREAEALGFTRVLCPASNELPPGTSQRLSVDRVAELLERLR